MAKKNLKSSEEAFGVIGLTLGILGIIMMFSNGLIMSVVGLVLSIIQQRKNPTKIGKAGIIVNIIAIILTIILVILLATVFRPFIETQFAGAFPTS